MSKRFFVLDGSYLDRLKLSSGYTGIRLVMGSDF